MKMTKPEIEEELTHQRELFRDLRSQQRILERRLAQQGSFAPPQFEIDNNNLAKQIRECENKISQLEKLTVEEQMPFAEAEYRLLLAKAWKVPHIRPELIDEIQLEIERLRLHISTERAQELEQEVRVALIKKSIMV